MDEAKNFAKGTLTQGYDDAATSIVLTAGDGARFPGAPFNAVWWNASDYPDPADDPAVEIVRVTAKSTDTFTVTRGAEGGAGAMTHELEGKTYKLAAGLTAKVINEDLPGIGHTGNDYVISSVGKLQFEANASRLLDLGVSDSLDVQIGDIDVNNSGVKIHLDDSLGQCSITGKLGTDQSAAATTLGTVTKKLEIFDNTGASLGFIPIYNSIT